MKTLTVSGVSVTASEVRLTGTSDGDVCVITLPLNLLQQLLFASMPDDLRKRTEADSVRLRICRMAAESALGDGSQMPTLKLSSEDEQKLADLDLHDDEKQIQLMKHGFRVMYSHGMSDLPIEYGAAETIVEKSTGNLPTPIG